MDTLKAWSVFRRVQIDGMIQQGQQDTLCGTLGSHSKTITIQYTLNCRPGVFCDYDLRNICYDPNRAALFIHLARLDIQLTHCIVGGEGGY